MLTLRHFLAMHSARASRAKSQTTNNKTDQLLKYLDITLKLSGITLIIGIAIGSFIIVSYLRHNNVSLAIHSALSNTETLKVIAETSFALFIVVLSVGVATPILYSYTKTLISSKRKIKKREEILFDFFVFYTSLTIHIIASEYSQNHSYLTIYTYCLLFLGILCYVAFVGTFGFFKNLKGIFEFISCSALFAYAILLSSITLYVILYVILDMGVYVHDDDISQTLVLLLTIITYALATSVAINNNNKIIVSVFCILFSPFLGLFFFQEYIPKKIIAFSGLGQYQTEMRLDKPLAFLDNEFQSENEYINVWILINLGDKLIISKDKKNNEYHIIPGKYILDIKPSPRTIKTITPSR